MSNDYSASMTTANTPKTLTVTRPAVLPVCQQARLSRNSRFDGRFFVAVVTTGVYCRPICPGRLPAEANVRYFATGGRPLIAATGRVDDVGQKARVACRNGH